MPYVNGTKIEIPLYKKKANNLPVLKNTEPGISFGYVNIPGKLDTKKYSSNFIIDDVYVAHGDL